jgi:hypothetical protein
MYLVATFDSEAMPDDLLLHRLDAQGTGGDWRGLAHMFIWEWLGIWFH